MFQQYQGLPPDQRSQVSQAYRKLREMTPEQRTQYFNSDEFHNSFNDQQRDLLRGMAELYPSPGSLDARFINPFAAEREIPQGLKPKLLRLNGAAEAAPLQTIIFETRSRKRHNVRYRLTTGVLAYPSSPEIS